MVAPITAASACAFHTVKLPSQNYSTKEGIKRGTNNLGQGHGLGVKRASCGGLQIKANARNYNDDAKISRVATISSIRQNFTIRSYEVDANGVASIETLMNYFQSSMIDHCKTLGIHNNNLNGSTNEMIKRNLVWVYTEMQLSTYRYPKWDDVVEVETWLSTEGKNALRLNWSVQDFKTNQMLNRASSVCVLMNKLTRRLSKMPEEVRREYEPHIVNSRIIIEGEDKKIPKVDDTTADYICTGLTNIPQSILMNYELSAMSLKFKRECKIDSKLQSLTEVCSDDNNSNNNVEYNHMVRSEDGVEILRGRTEWRPKPTNSFDNFNHVPEAFIKDF
ncbi:palmitoyl-acyl carrier protein thioesterase, chloroplastic-like isoform X2 [Arachis ipaensis]|uniref:palmitoyl-acyl carrier protein thioesterase, chloroplastic-like isoform X2 n=1 Tax=Arachis ipaensis TaxID=130454 RepID=UPI000A2B98D3|nr:palmitoyl-acyl carrier protein thioesterase, chloroplastic-like isoform X2 [Arachis ipaensis]